MPRGLVFLFEFLDVILNSKPKSGNWTEIIMRAKSEIYHCCCCMSDFFRNKPRVTRFVLNHLNSKIQHMLILTIQKIRLSKSTLWPFSNHWVKRGWTTDRSELKIGGSTTRWGDKKARRGIFLSIKDSHRKPLELQPTIRQQHWVKQLDV